jgi:hypothetical protein
LRFGPGARKSIILAAGFLSFAASPVRSVGPFVDVSRESAFIRAPLVRGLAGSITRADLQGDGASFFTLEAQIRVRSVFLIQPEVSYISIARDDEVDDGFGDTILRAKARVWTGPRKCLSIISSLRLGSGSASLFPYSTGSIDVEAGLAFVDSIGSSGDGHALEPLRSLSYWAVVSGVYVMRLDDTLEEDELHSPYGASGGGILAALTRRIELEAGGVCLFFETGAVREVFFSTVTAALSPAMDFYLTVQGEGGDWRERATDASATLGLSVRY